LLDRVREETPDDPLWSGVHEMREAARTARIEFRDDIVDPPLYRVSSPGRPDVDVACLLYRSGKDGGVPPARG
jgi:hypothetical protein